MTVVFALLAALAGYALLSKWSSHLDAAERFGVSGLAGLGFAGLVTLLLGLLPNGLAFALWTIANLLPRARSHHRWYREKFPEYPPERRALVPGLF